MKKKYEVRVFRDDDPESPREAWDNLGTMVCAHSKYKLGDIQVSDGSEGLVYIAGELGIDCEPYEAGDISTGAMLALIKEEAIMLPLSLYDHSGITMSVGEGSDRWDSMMVGFIFASKQKLIEQTGYSKEEILDEKGEELLKEEVEIYDQYLRGNVYVLDWEEFDNNDNSLGSESIGGYYGDDLEKNGIFDQLPGELVEVMKKEGYTQAFRFDGEYIDFSVGKDQSAALVEPNQDMNVIHREIDHGIKI